MLQRSRRLLMAGGRAPWMLCRNWTIDRTKDNAMLLAFLQAYWWAPVISLGALLVQCTRRRPEVALRLLVLTALAWGIPLTHLWGQTRTVRGGCGDRSGPLDTLTPDNTPK